MATLREHFETDFVGYFTLEAEFDVRGVDGKMLSNVSARRHVDFASETQFSSFFFVCEDDQQFFDICRHFCISNSTAVGLLNPSKVTIGRGVSIANGEEITLSREVIRGQQLTTLSHQSRISSNFLVCRPVYVYSPYQPSDQTLAETSRFFDVSGFRVTFRHNGYAKAQDMIAKPSAFVSHDSRDKEVAREIAQELQKMTLSIWYDEFSLKPGDRLRESIEKGLKECKSCIVLLSPHFLANPGWTTVEFNSIFTRELMEREDRIIPVWHGVTAKEVYEYSPTLADRVAARWGEDDTMKKLAGAVIRRDSDQTSRRG